MLEARLPGRLAWEKGANDDGTSFEVPAGVEGAVRLVLESGRPIRHVAADLGVHHEALRLWVHKARADETPAASRVLPTDVEAELGREKQTRLPQNLIPPPKLRVALPQLFELEAKYPALTGR